MGRLAPLAGDIRIALIFYTRLPVRHAGEHDLTRALWASPIAGAVVGLLCGAALTAAHLLGASPTVAAVLALSVGVAVTGALHEDGLADVADGFGGGRTLARKLEIMRDSRVGSYGVCALALSLLLRFAALTAVLDRFGLLAAGLALVAAHAAGRALVPVAMRLMPNARTDGLSAGIPAPTARAAAVSAGLGVVALLPLGPAHALVALLLLAVWLAALSRLAMAQIGGRTGDVLGALEQGGEAAVLITAGLLFAI